MDFIFFNNEIQFLKWGYFGLNLFAKRMWVLPKIKSLPLWAGGLFFISHKAELFYKNGIIRLCFRS